jgi:Uncharacterized conserved protein (DUF2190)
VADYTPVLPGGTFTFTSGGFIAPGDPVELSGPMQVIRAGPDPAGGLYVGIAGHEAGGGEFVTVHVSAVIHKGPAEGAIGWGQVLAAAAGAGRQVRPLISGPGSHVIGYALADAVDGQPVQWMSLTLRVPGSGAGGASGAAWAAPAGAALAAGNLVDCTPTGTVVPSPDLSPNAIGTVYQAAAPGDIAVVHLVGPLLHARAWDVPVAAGDPIVAAGGAHVRPATPAEIAASPRDVLGIALTAAAAQDAELTWVARH